MSKFYANVILTVIAVLLAAITAKLYLPGTQQFGPRIGFPTRGDLAAATEIKDAKIKAARMDELKRQMPVVWIRGGDIDVSGSTVTVDGEVEIRRRW